MKTTKSHEEYWRNRKIDWKTSYLDTWDHPHRNIISGLLSRFKWLSLIEVGCGAGANLINIIKRMPGRQVGGTDINPDAIACAQEHIKGAMFKVCPADDIMMSDKSSDITLSDMCLIYTGPLVIDKTVRELMRITRNYLFLCEFHSTSWWARFKLWWTSGYFAYNWRKKLEKLGCYDILEYKLRPEDWPGGNPQKDFGYIFIASVPTRY